MAGSFVLNTGASIPSVGLGTWRIQPEVVGDTIYAAVKAGYRHIDCAPAYSNEKEVGLALKKLFEHGVVKREELFVTSKLWSGNHAPEDVPEAIDTTLNDLQLDYLDLFLAHSPLGEASILGNHIVVSVAERVRKTPAQVALRWGLQMGQMGQSVLPRSANEGRIKENLDIFDWSIPGELMAKFSEIKQVRLVKAEFAVHPLSGYKTLQDFWDGEI